MAIIVIRNNSKRDITLNIGTESIHIPPYSAVPPVSGLGKVEDSALKEGMKHQAIKGLFDCGDLKIESRESAPATGLAALKKDELVEKAVELGIEKTEAEKLNKTDLIEAIEKAEAAKDQ